MKTLSEKRKELLKKKPAGDCAIRLVELRLSQNKTVDQFIKETNLTKDAYHKYEQGERFPPTEILMLIADYYGVSLDYLTGGKDYETADQEYICEKTGLDQEVVRKLIREKSYYDRLGYEAIPTMDSSCFKSMNLINSLIRSEEYEDMIYCFMRLCESNLRKELLEHNVKLNPFDEYTEIDFIVDRDSDNKLLFIREDTNEKIRIDQDITGRIAFDTNNLRTSFDNYIKKAVSTFVNDKMISECLKKAKRSPSAINNKDLEAEARRTGRLFDEADWRKNWRKQT